MPGLNAETGVVGIKIEAVEGVAETIAAAQCGILVEEPEFTIEPKMNQRKPARPYMGGIKQVPGGKSCSMKFKTEIKGSGAVGTAPAWGVALRCCGFAETNEAGVKSAYTPNLVGTNIPSCTIKLLKDGKYRTMRGARGTVSCDVEGNGIGYLAFEFQGVYEAEGDATAPTGIVYETTQPPVLNNADLVLLPYHAQSVNPPATYAVHEVLRDGAASNIKLAISITTTVATDLKVVRARLRQGGTPAAEVSGLQMSVMTDVGGDPGALVGTASRYVKLASIPVTAVAGGEWTDFYFDTPVPLAGATTYWLVLTGDYTESAVNYVAWQTVACLLAGQRSKFYDAAWAAVALKNFVFQALSAAESQLLVAGVSWDLGNTVGLRDNVNDFQGFQGGWVSQRLAVGKIEPEEELAANRDFLAELIGQTDLCLLFKLGSVAGNRVYFQMPYTQVVGAGGWGNRNGVMTRPLDLQYNQNDGGDDIVIVCR